MVATLAVVIGGFGAAHGQKADKKKSSYDPNKLLDQGADGGELFQKEPRDDYWADVVEQVLGDQITKDLRLLVPGANVGLHCKTLSCIVGITAPEDKRLAAVAVARLVMMGPSLIELGKDDKGIDRWIFFCEPRFGDPKVLVPWYRKVRKQVLADIRNGKRPNPLPFPVDKLPKE